MEKEIRITPYNLEAEMTILGSVFIKEDEVIADVLDRLDKMDFYDQKNQIMYTAIKNLYDKKTVVDYQTVSNELKDMALLDAVGGSDYILTLINYVPTVINIGAYIDIVKDNALKRKVIEVTTDIANKGYDKELSTKEYIDMAERSLFEITNKRRTTSLQSIREVAEVVRKKTEENMNSDGNVTGLTTGYTQLDEYTLGFHPEELIILAARPAMGKSAMAMNLAYNVAKYNHNGGAAVAIFSLEMGADQLVSRIISLDAQIDGKKIRTGQLMPNEWAIFNEKIEELGKLNISFEDDANVTVSDIRAKCRKLKREKGLDMVVIDYLQLIKGENSRNSRQEEVANISRSLKQMARELKVCVIALAQLSRKVEERDDKRPNMSDLRESGSIEQDADIVSFLYREGYYNKDKADSGKTELIISKNRQGTSGVSVNFIFQASMSRFISTVETED